MSNPAPAFALVPQAPTTPDERSLATLAHILQLIGGWIAPLIIFLVKRQSRFVSFHALQVLLLHLVYLCVMFLFIISVVILVVLGIVTSATTANHGSPAGAFLFILIPFFWIGWFALWIVTLVWAIVYGIKASRGEWAEYPVVGRYARQILKIGPGGAFLS